MKLDFDELKNLFAECAWHIHYETVGHDVNYAFREDDSHLFIFFEGSKDITEKRGWIDWLRNFWFFPSRKKPYKGMEDTFYVHSGFLAAWKEVEDIIFEKISQKNERGSFYFDDITVVGFSHGAALACLAHEFIWYHRQDICENGLVTYAFESPRIYGGFRIKDDLKERWVNCFVFRNGTDLVTHLPPRLFGFSHVGYVVCIRGDLTTVKDRLPKCVKYHNPLCVYDALLNHL